MDGEPLQADFIDVTVNDECCHSFLYITRRYAAASRSHCRNCQAHWNGIAETIYDNTRENTRLRDLYLLSMEMCFHKAGTWNNLPDNPWHWGSRKVRWTIRDRAASQLRVCSLAPCLNLLNTRVFFTLLTHYPLKSYSIQCDRFTWSNNKKYSSPPSLPSTAFRRQRGCRKHQPSWRPHSSAPLLQAWPSGWFTSRKYEWKCGPFQASLSLEAAELLPQLLFPFDAWRQKSHRPSGNGGITTPKNPEGPGRNCAEHKREVKFYLTAKPMEI